ncbi:DUF2306 domain-containing protein [Paenisporosarcina cavernae]|uniref:DUF2306 domain-containing protein n=1 Tax=Paenisporosarcina cavernae TaxID=2320858 RepID=A0A385YPX9_9BACL|nr:DUF2306 domain-containing protein [Paenisporosarcina cavernae]AYC28501.1 DUF2306 domain-containing protein [Paenisporosarcina cavernae]
MKLYGMILTIHIVTGFICLISGLAAMFARKRRGLHTFAGELYHASYVVVAVSAIILAILSWEKSAFLFFIAIFSYGFALWGYLSIKRRKRGFLGPHIGGMLGSYIGVVTATLVTNADQLPFLQDLPYILVWLLPTIIGTPLIFYIGSKYAPKKVMP